MKVTSTIQTMFSIALAMLALVGTTQAHDDRPDIDREDNVVYVDGTVNEDHCVIYIERDRVEVVVWYYDDERDERWENVDKTYRLSRVDRIVFNGYAGDDTVSNDTNIPMDAYGGAGDDWLIGGDADDYLDGGTGFDSVRGYGGDDRLVAGPWIEDERETIGGEGQDTFVTPFRWSFGSGVFQQVTSSIGYSDFDPTEDIKERFYSYGGGSIRP